MPISNDQAFHSTLFAYYLEKLRATPDGDGSLLDHLLIVYGAGMADSNLHATTDLPLVLAGGATGALKGGRHVKYPSATPLANLHLTMLDMFGVPTVDRLATAPAARTPDARLTARSGCRDRRARRPDEKY